MRRLWVMLLASMALINSSLAEPMSNDLQTTVNPAPLVMTQISDHTILMGNSLTVSQPIAGDALIIGGNVELQGDIDGDVTIIAGHASVLGHVKGDVTAIGGHIDIGPLASIEGDVKFLQSASLKVDKGAHIQGRLEPMISSHRHEQTQVAIISEKSQRFPILFYSGLFLVGLILCLVFPRQSINLLNNVWQRPGMALVSGLGVLIVVPVVILFSMISLVGIPFSLILLGLYLASLWLAYAYAAWLLGAGLAKFLKPNIGLNSAIIRILLLSVGLAGLYLIGTIPYFGPCFKAIGLLLGIGGITISLIGSGNTMVKS